MNIDRAKEKARRFEQKRQFDKAIDLYSVIIGSLEGKPELLYDLSLFNKLGDLYLKVGDVGSAADNYERAADLYSDQGLPNNAIALCNKILRNAPGRTPIYLKLAKLLMQRGFVAEVKRNLVEYTERMGRAGEQDRALEALVEFVELHPVPGDVLLLVAARLLKAGREDEARTYLSKLYDEVAGQGVAARQAVLRDIRALDPDFGSDSGSATESDPEGSAEDEIVFITPGDSDDFEITLSSVEFEVPDETESGETETSPTADLPLIHDPALEDSHGDDVGAAFELEEPAVIDLGPPDEPAPLPDGIAEGAGDDEAANGASALGDDTDPNALRAADEPEPTAAADPAVPAHIARLEDKVAEHPDVLEIHRELAEALLEYGDRERGLAELDTVLLGCEELQDWHKAQAVVEEILRITPNSVVHHWKRVRYVERNGLILEPGSFERGRWVVELVESNLDLGDALVREGSIDEARSVYERVLRYDQGNARAATALDTVGVTTEQGGAAATEAPEAGTSAAEDDGDRDYRWRIPEITPTGEEEQDFQAVLAEFKKGIESRMGDGDPQAHFDLGVAFKEMGLVDEAISEFQKSLGASGDKLRAAEALGRCFFEKGQYSVAATVLRRAVETEAPDDADKLGLLYWLGRCEQEQGNVDAALQLYEQIAAADASFRDISERVQRLPQAGT